MCNSEYFKRLGSQAGDRSFPGEQGYTLLEVIFSLSLFSIATAALFPAFIDHIRFNTFAEVRSASYQAAQAVLDDIRLDDPASLPSSGSDAGVQVTIGERIFDVVVTYCLEASMCGASTRHLTVTVSYNNEEMYEVETVFTQLE